MDYCSFSNPVGATTCDNNVVVAKDYRCKFPVCQCGDGSNVNPPSTVVNTDPPVSNPPPGNPPNADAHAQEPTPDCGTLTLLQYGDVNPGPLVDGGANETAQNVGYIFVSPIPS